MYEPHEPLAADARHVPATGRDHPEAFDRLLAELEPRYQQADTRRKTRRPRRRPPKGQLTPRQKAGNRRVSRRRIAVEHGIGKMKVWGIAAERYRNPRRRHTLIIKNVAGLHNPMYA